MKRLNDMKSYRKPALMALGLSVVAGPAAAVDFYLAAKAYTNTLPDGTTVPMWGYVLDAGDGTTAHCYGITGAGSAAARRACVNALPDPGFPGPRLEIPPGDNVLRIFLTNTLPEPTSIIIPGQRLPWSNNDNGPTWDDGGTGARNPNAATPQRVRSFGREANRNGGRRAYVWNNFRGTTLDGAGTLTYHSGTWPQKQVYMGLAGLVTKDAAAGEAHPGVPYDNAVDLFYSDIDPDFNLQVAATANTKGMSAVDRHPTWFLVNGAPYEAGMADITEGTAGALTGGSNTLLRLASTATDTHVAVLQGLQMMIHAEDGIQYNYQESGTAYPAPRVQYSAMLPPAKTKDAMVMAPPGGGRVAVYDGNGYMTNPSDPANEAVGDTVGGMLRFLSFAAGNTPPTVDAVADQTNLEGDAVSLQVAASDADAGDTLSYLLSGAPAGLGIDASTGLISGTIAAGAAGSSPYTATVDVSDGTDTTSVSFTWTVTVPPPATQLTVSVNGVPQAFDVLSYGGNQDINATTDLLDGGSTLRIVGNGWKQVEFSCNVGAATVLSFDFSSSAQGEIHGIGFDTDNNISANRTFQLYGTQNYGRQNFHNYAGGVTSYSIPVGAFYTGSFSRLFFVMDHDVGNPTGESVFSNLTVTGCQ